ncbi:MAG: protein translocase subunit SecD [Solirubrobacteraceae bacterium]
MTDRQRNGFILLLVLGLIAVSGVVIASKKTFLGLDLQGGVELVYKATPTPQSGVTPQALARAVDIMRQRVDQLGVSQPAIDTTGGNQITVQLPNVKDTNRAEKQVGSTAGLYFYDWEANALTPNGKTVASQLLAQDPTATQMSQGGTAAPGSPGVGSTGLYGAIKLAESVKNPPIGTMNSTQLPRYYAFGAPGSPACQTAGKALKYTPATGQYCYLGGPDQSQSNLLQNGLPAGVSASQAQVLVIPRGVVVLEAVPSSFANQPKLGNPTNQYYTLLDNVGLLGKHVTNPTQSTDQAGAPNVAFNFDSYGANQFQNVTGQIAKRGQLDHTVQAKLAQHFAVALDTTLITVPSIDYIQYPQGIISTGSGAEITGNFTLQSAQDLANELRLGALPINLKLISTQQVSATLGKQALNQGLLAGAIGLAVVVLFLLAYYRILGLIATAGLAVYALYFYGLIKLIPITLSLSGIAGLILTIGVAADANIVIFERVKEEIRAGRSIRQGIAIGYRKGLTAIIDANVVTIMTAFILFVLATSDVKGFAFTLGIGTIVSLFTAVMATQAILFTLGSSKVISRPSALGAGGKKRVWHYDFMGASKYFFSLSGCILLIGALAIGGRGLNLGIDFTSGTQISVGTVKPATQSQMTSLINSLGINNARVQRVFGTGSPLGKYGFQIDTNKLSNGTSIQQQRQRIYNAINQRYGVAQTSSGARFNFTSVGPTFGTTVANDAVKAIIASLLVISAYIALRFQWKFAVPVLIALMHDLLITSGVYALTGRTVSADTVAALLTILGYSLYDTIIVFDRVRENIPRMPRAAFSQIVNRSMSEVLTRSIATTSCTLMPVIALLLFGGSTLKDFAFALLIGVASGAYSSIFIASPVLTHWYEREPAYRARRRRITEDLGSVPAYAGGAADIEPEREGPRRPGRLTTPEAENVSAAEFEQMKRDLEIEPKPSKAGRTSRLTSRLAHTDEAELQAEPERPARAKLPQRQPKPAGSTKLPQRQPRPSTPGSPSAPASQTPKPPVPAKPGDRLEPEVEPEAAVENSGDEHYSAPDVAENEGMVSAPNPTRPQKPRNRNRRHGRR